MGDATYFRRLGLCVAVSLATALLIAAIGYVPTVRMAGRENVTTMLLGCGVSWLAGCAGAVWIASAAAGSASQQSLGVLGSTAVRFAAVLVMVVPIVLSGAVDKRVFVFWVVLSYLVLLMVDTALAVRLLNRDDKNET